MTGPEPVVLPITPPPIGRRTLYPTGAPGEPGAQVVRKAQFGLGNTRARRVRTAAALARRRRRDRHPVEPGGLISGGTALVEAAGRYVGLVDGLAVGPNQVRSRSPAALAGLVILRRAQRRATRCPGPA